MPQDTTIQHNSPIALSNKSQFYPWVVWGLGAAFFFAGYFARVSINVMVPDLMVAFHVSSLILGSLGAYFYWPYISMQLPVGLLIDRYGAKKLLTIMTLVTGASCVMFGHSHAVFGADMGRVLMGFSTAFAFVGAMKLAADWFPANRLGLLAGLTQALGMVGAALGTAPVSFLVEQIGWRHTMYFIASIFVVLSSLIFIVIRDRKQESNTETKQASHNILENLMIVIRNPLSWENALYAGLIFAPIAAFAELWGSTFLEHVYAMSRELAATGVSLIFIGWGIGGPLMGMLSDSLGKRKPLMILSGIICGLSFLTILYLPQGHNVLVLILLFVFGASNTGLALSYAYSTEINPHEVAGTSLAFTNMASVAVGAALQPFIGWMIDLRAATPVGAQAVYNAGDYRFAMVVLPICLIASGLLAFRLKETNCLNICI